MGTFEQAVLLAIVRLREEAYGAAIVTEVEARLRRSVPVGAVHATLVRLEGKRMVSSRTAPGDEQRAGRPRRYYTLEPRGLRALAEARQALAHMWRGFRLPLPGDT